MSFIAVAIGGSALIGAGASIIGGNKAANAQRETASENMALGRDQIAENARQYDITRADYAPYREAGYTALGQLAKGTSDGGEFNRNFSMSDFEADPGYEFRRAEGQRGLEASASARGGVLSGGTLKAIAKYNQDAASQDFGAAYGRYNSDLTGRFNRLSSLAGTGQTATGQTAAAGQAMTAQNGQATAGIIDANNASGNARASQYVNTANAVGSAANSVGQYFALKDLYKVPKTPGAYGITGSDGIY